jgi:cytidylate kinase
MHFVTFSRKMGAGGEEIARQVAKRLRYRFYDTTAIEATAREMGFLESVQSVDEKRPSFFQRVLSEQPTIQLDRLWSVVYELGSRGNSVFLGRGSHLLLKSFQCGLHVRVTASREKRIQNLMSRGYQRDEAEASVDESDRERSSFIRFAFDVDWDVPELYDTVLNTDKLSPELAVKTIVTMARSKEIQACSIDALRAMEMTALEYRVQAAIMEARLPSIAISAVVTAPGHVVLEGAVQMAEAKRKATIVVKRVKGVTSVEDNLVVSPIMAHG